MQAIRQQLEPKRSNAFWEFEIFMSHFTASPAIGLPLLIAIAGAANADGRGTIGPRSSATVQIGVSVAPRFALLTRKTDEPEADRSTGGPGFASNLPGFRYSVHRVPVALPEAPAADRPGQVELLLISPE